MVERRSFYFIVDNFRKTLTSFVADILSFCLSKLIKSLKLSI